MIQYLSTDDVMDLQRRIVETSGGSGGIRDHGLIESAVAQPQATFDGIDLYPTLAEKAAALAFSLIKNHCFIDGNKRIGHAAMEDFLVRNGFILEAGVDEQEKVILDLAAGSMKRETFVEWITHHLHRGDQKTIIDFLMHFPREQ